MRASEVVELEPVDVVVNADDLGATPEVNDAIFDFVDQGRVSSATLIANGPYVEEACGRLNQFPHCSFGVHLNVVEFKPLTGPDKLEPLLDETGISFGNLIRQVPIDATLAQGIFEEFCAQIEKLHDLGVKVTHIDSHLQVHAMPKVFPLLKKVQKRFQIRKVRISRNIYGLGETTPWQFPNVRQDSIGTIGRPPLTAFNFLN